MKYSKYILFLLITIVTTDAFRLISAVGLLSVDNATYISAALNYLSLFILICFAYKNKLIDDVPKSIRNLFKLWLIWNIFSIVHGFFAAKDYWDWKSLMLSSVPFSLIPLVFFIGKSLPYTKFNLKIVLRYLFLFGFLFLPLAFTTNEQLYSRLMIPISLFIVFIPYLKLKWKLLILVVAVTSILAAFGFRTNIIKIVFSLLLIPAYYFRKHIKQSWFRIAHFILFMLPLIFLISALLYNFNIFQALSNYQGDVVTTHFGAEKDLASDTRSFLYIEVISSIVKTNHWLLGESAAGSYQSYGFVNDGGAINGRRWGSEVGILNILLYDGVIGILIYFLFLFQVSKIAIKESNNILAKLLGLFIAFRWPLLFIEEFTQFDLNFYFFWLTVGLISTYAFRKSTETEIENFLNL